MTKYFLKAIYLARGNGVHSPQHLDDMLLVAGQRKAWRIFWVQSILNASFESLC